MIKIGAFLDTFTICSKIQGIAPIFGKNSKKFKYLIFLGAGLYIIFMFWIKFLPIFQLNDPKVIKKKMTIDSLMLGHILELKQHKEEILG